MAAADRGRGHDRPWLPAALDRRRAPGILLGAGRQRSDRGWFYFRHDEETARKAKVLNETRRRMGHPMLDVRGQRPVPVLLYEVYDDATALDAHRATAHFKEFRETAAPMIARRVARHMSPVAFNIKAR
jgi:quinol monooxygenase YgiN